MHFGTPWYASETHPTSCMHNFVCFFCKLNYKRSLLLIILIILLLLQIIIILIILIIILIILLLILINNNNFMHIALFKTKLQSAFHKNQTRKGRLIGLSLSSHGFLVYFDECFYFLIAPRLTATQLILGAVHLQAYLAEYGY